MRDGPRDTVDRTHCKLALASPTSTACAQHAKTGAAMSSQSPAREHDQQRHHKGLGVIYFKGALQLDTRSRDVGECQDSFNCGDAFRNEPAVQAAPAQSTCCAPVQSAQLRTDVAPRQASRAPSHRRQLAAPVPLQARSCSPQRQRSGAAPEHSTAGTKVGPAGEAPPKRVRANGLTDPERCVSAKRGRYGKSATHLSERARGLQSLFAEGAPYRGPCYTFDSKHPFKSLEGCAIAEFGWDAAHLSKVHAALMSNVIPKDESATPL
jgi:hypothetical protein